MLLALRLRFIVAPEWLVAAKNWLDWHCSTPVQIGVAGFIAEGHLAHHVRKMRDIYKRRRRLLLDFLGDNFGEWLYSIPSFYGMHVAAEARTARDRDGVAGALLRHNVKIHTFSRHYLGPQTKKGLIFGYGAVHLPQMNRGLSFLRKALHS